MSVPNQSSRPPSPPKLAHSMLPPPTTKPSAGFLEALATMQRLEQSKNKAMTPETSAPRAFLRMLRNDLSKDGSIKDATIRGYSNYLMAVYQRLSGVGDAPIGAEFIDYIVHRKPDAYAAIDAQGWTKSVSEKARTAFHRLQQARGVGEARHKRAAKAAAVRRANKIAHAGPRPPMPGPAPSPVMSLAPGPQAPPAEEAPIIIASAEPPKSDVDSATTPAENAAKSHRPQRQAALRPRWREDQVDLEVVEEVQNALAASRDSVRVEHDLLLGSAGGNRPRLALEERFPPAPILHNDLWDTRGRDDELAALRGEHTRLKADEVDVLRRQLTLKEAESRIMAEEVAELRTFKASLRGREATLEARSHGLIDDLAREHDTTQALMRKVQDLQQQRRELSAALAAARHTINDLSQDNEALRAREVASEAPTAPNAPKVSPRAAVPSPMSLGVSLPEGVDLPTRRNMPVEVACAASIDEPTKETVPVVSEAAANGEKKRPAETMAGGAIQDAKKPRPDEPAPAISEGSASPIRDPR